MKFRIVISRYNENVRIINYINLQSIFVVEKNDISSRNIIFLR